MPAAFPVRRANGLANVTHLDAQPLATDSAWPGAGPAVPTAGALTAHRPPGGPGPALTGGLLHDWQRRNRDAAAVLLRQPAAAPPRPRRPAGRRWPSARPRCPASAGRSWSRRPPRRCGPGTRRACRTPPGPPRYRKRRGRGGSLRCRISSGTTGTGGPCASGCPPRPPRPPPGRHNCRMATAGGDGFAVPAATPADAAPVAAIYAPLVAGTAISFEETPPGPPQRGVQAGPLAGRRLVAASAAGGAGQPRPAPAVGAVDVRP